MDRKEVAGKRGGDEKMWLDLTNKQIETRETSIIKGTHHTHLHVHTLFHTHMHTNYICYIHTNTNTHSLWLSLDVLTLLEADRKRKRVRGETQTNLERRNWSSCCTALLLHKHLNSLITLHYSTHPQTKEFLQHG